MDRVSEYHLNVIGRKSELFLTDINDNHNQISEIVSKSSFIVLGGGGSIGRAVCKLIFSLNPKSLIAVDSSENNLAELVRDIRSELGYATGEFKTVCIAVGDPEFDLFIREHLPVDYVINLFALKHVRSEKDKYTLMRMFRTNILLSVKLAEILKDKPPKKLFCVSSDKATNPANLMGASKRLMELFLEEYSSFFPISFARFANVAFSDGSILQSYQNRLQKQQPLVVPSGIKRYFIIHSEAAWLCLMATIFGKSTEVYFPAQSPGLDLVSMEEIVENFLNLHQLTPFYCDDEHAARTYFNNKTQNHFWPCYLSETNTSGEKPFEEFHDAEALVDYEQYSEIGVTSSVSVEKDLKLSEFLKNLSDYIETRNWSHADLVNMANATLPELKHILKSVNLDEKM